MKKIYLFFLTIACISLAGCSDEETFSSSEMESISRFEFPEGDKDCDKILEDIFEEHGVRVIYKGWTEKDWSKSWLGEPASHEYVGEHFVNEELDSVVNRMNKEFFSYLNPEISKAILKPYIYLVKDYGYWFQFHPSIPARFNPVVYPSVAGMDNRLISPNMNIVMGTETPLKIKQFRCNILYHLYIADAINRGVIVQPANIYDGLDMTTAVIEKEGDPNHYLARGYVKGINIYFTGLDHFNGSNNPKKYVGEANTLYFREYVMWAMLHPEEEMQTKYGSYPIVMEKYNLVVDYMKEKYGLDLKAMAKVYE